MNYIRVTEENDEKLGNIIYIQNTLEDSFTAYLKLNERFVVRESTKDKAYKELKRIIKRFREVD